MPPSKKRPVKSKSAKPKVKLPQAPKVLYQATLLGDRAMFAKLGAFPLDIMKAQRQPSAGARREVRAILRPDQLERVVASGTSVLLERLIDPAFPKASIMSDSKALAEARAVIERVKRAAKAGQRGKR